MTKLCLILAALLYCVLIVLALRPAFDLDAARAFYLGAGRFVGMSAAGTVLRYAAWATPFVVLAALLVAGLLGRFGLVPAGFAPRSRTLLYLVLSLAIGPGLLIHTTLKEISHRPRPTAIAAFGGGDAFRPFYRFDGACPHNCAFPSGEAAVATWMLAPASLVPPPWRGPALAAALAFAGATSLWRMALGAHFLSDVCGGALIVVLVLLVLRKAPRIGRH